MLYPLTKSVLKQHPQAPLFCWVLWKDREVQRIIENLAHIVVVFFRVDDDDCITLINW